MGSLLLFSSYHQIAGEKFPPPRRGRARVGVILGNFSHLQEIKGDLTVFQRATLLSIFFLWPRKFFEKEGFS
jgi:hypothetical protein